ncbi:Putative tRNA pseudouridine synthase C25B8.05 [Durusdinium trenchii]|uniref:tRNA pseudouridine synthase n=1 Tax=Durusdinium trenchii TaxID=1381693 RepID=A0ABP0IZW7_9DINO
MGDERADSAAVSDETEAPERVKTMSEAKRRKKGQRDFDWSKATFQHFVLKMAYVGTNYHGNAWQDPKICPTVEAALFEALMKTRLIQDRTSCNFSRCGRTDKGVHAAGNYIALKLRLKPGDEDFDYPGMLNAVLPMDVRILACARAPETFDARFSCLYRAYQYYFPYAGEDLDRMRRAAEHFVGEHDFRNFCKMDIENVSNYRRKVLSVSVRPSGAAVAMFAVTGMAFLWHQVRCMAAVLLLIGAGLEEVEVVKELLDVEKWPRKPLYEPADESGLVLRDCGFPDVPFAPGTCAPAAGETAVRSPSKCAEEAFQAMLQRHQRSCAVFTCLAEAAAGDDAAGRKQRKHVPLLQRGLCPSLEEKQQAMHDKRRAKSEAEEQLE